MGEQRTKYKFTDDDGDEHIVVHVERWCRCAGMNCEDDELEYYDPLDPPGSSPYRLEPITGTEMKWLITEMIANCVESGKWTKCE